MELISRDATTFLLLQTLIAGAKVATTCTECSTTLLRIENVR